MPTTQNSKPLVRVTQIEAFRRYFYQSEHDNYEIPEQSVIDSITGAFQGNEMTRIGTAFHALVQTGCQPCSLAPAGSRSFSYYGKEKQEPVPEGRTFLVDGHEVTLDLSQIKVALDYRYRHINAFHEILRFYDFGFAVVTGCADMIDCVQIRDIKTKFSPPQDDNYVNSCQWRYYLQIFGADVFFFDLFRFEGYKLEKHGYDVRGLPLTPHTPPICLYRYADMERDNRILLEEFLEWVDRRSLTSYLLNQTIK